MTLLTSVLLVAEPLLLGLKNYISPDFLMNPDDGLLRAVTPIRKTSLDTNHIDPINRVLIMACGACMLAMATMQILAKDTLAKRAFLRTKLYNNIFLLIVSLHTTRIMDNTTSMLNPKNIGFFAGLQLANVMWLATDMIHYYHHQKDDVPRTVAKPAHLATFAGFACLYVGGWSIIKLFYPEALLDPLPFWNKTPLEDEVTLDELSVFFSKVEGAYLLTFSLTELDGLIFDRSVERIRWANTFFIVTLAFYLMVFFRAVMDSSGYLNRGGFATLSVLHCGLVVLTLRFGPDLPMFKIKTKTVKDEATTGKKMQKVVEPTLVEETKKVK